jgi:hypothetical protein
MAKKAIPFVRENTDAGPSASELAQGGGAKGGKKSARKDRSKTVRLTIDLPQELEFRLDNVARTQRQHKGAFALRLIDQGLRSYKADASLKSVWAEICGQTGESVAESAA